jgi:hypothetical protein
MSFDERWFQLIKPIVFAVSEIGPITSGLSVSEEQVELFLSNDLENPEFVYDVNRFAQARIDNPVSELRSAIAASDTHAVVAELYDKKLERQLERQTLLAATIAGNDALFYELSSSLYGTPKKLYTS